MLIDAAIRPNEPVNVEVESSLDRRLGYFQRVLMNVTWLPPTGIELDREFHNVLSKNLMHLTYHMHLQWTHT